MNIRFLLLQAVIAVCINQGFSLTCPTCKGSKCSQVVAELECNRHFSPLPVEIGSKDKVVSENAQFGCLDLEYENGEDVTQLRQCIPVETDIDVCGELKEHLKVKKCSVSSYKLRNLLEAFKAVTTAAPTDPPTTQSSSVKQTSSMLTLFVVVLFRIHM